MPIPVQKHIVTPTPTDARYNIICEILYRMLWFDLQHYASWVSDSTLVKSEGSV